MRLIAHFVSEGADDLRIGIEAQIETALGNVNADRVAASDDSALTVARKRDPGPLFPWDAVLSRVPLRRIGA